MSHTNPPHARRATAPIVLLGMAAALLLFMLFAPFLAPYTPAQTSADDRFISPLHVRILEHTPDGMRLRPHIAGLPIRGRDPQTLRLTTVGLSDEKVYLGLFVDGAPYRLLGLVDAERHLFGPMDETQPMFLLGTDETGRDLLTLYIYGTRNSLDLWLGIVVLTVGVATLFGWLLGRYGGGLHGLAQRSLHLMQRIPTVVFRGLFLVLILWWWPFVNLLVLITLGRVDGVPPTAPIAWMLLLIAGTMTLLALVLHRRLLIWLLVVWIGLHFLNPLRWLFRGMRWLDGSAAEALRSTWIALQTLTDVQTTVVLILLMAAPLLIALVLAAYVTYLQRQFAVARTTTGEPRPALSVLQLLVPVSVYALAAMPLLILPEVNFFGFGMRAVPAGHLMLGRMLQDISNLAMWNLAPWTLAVLFVPVLILLVIELTLNAWFKETHRLSEHDVRQ